MTKHRRTRRTRRRSQRGGLFGFGESAEPADSNAPGFFSKLMGYGSTAVEKTKEGVNSLENGLGNMGTQASNVANSTFSAVGQGISSLNPFGSSTTSSQTTIPPATSPQTIIPQTTIPPATYSTQGGRRRRHARSMKGGNNGSGLVQYAAPVSNLKVAEPTYMIGPNTNKLTKMGGSRKRRGRKSRRTRRHKRR